MNQNTNDPPVTVCVLRRAKPGMEKEFERIIAGIITAASEFPGHLGTNIFRSPDSDLHEYRIIFKFDHLSNLQRWEDSDVRHHWLDLAAPLTDGEADVRVMTGLETWFTLPVKKAIVPPPRYKMAAISWLSIFPLINLINFLFASFLNLLPYLIRSLIVSVILVFLMTYVVMPRMTKLFARWLYPKQKLQNA
jgi:uncharacterized protein